jgi:putative oxygen-independent coproporphyrinogen III oxidase
VKHSGKSVDRQVGKSMYDEDWRLGGFGLYLHWPFCESKCPYCDFNSHVAKSIDQKQWLNAYLLEIERYGAETEGRILQSVYFGGGTPSLMDPEIVSRILEKMKQTWRTNNEPEITLEANPSSIEAGRFQAYRDGGVNRISMGMQAMNDADLRRLGRKHSAKEGVKAFDIARKCFSRVSFDLIYARQDQSLEAWKAELESALSLAVDHLSLYQLTIEDGTAFADRLSSGGLRGLPEEGLAADMYDLTQEICDLHGIPAYEVSNHARPGAESRHNLIYWQGGDYIGIGPGAHGRVTLSGTRYATEAPKSPSLWLQHVLTRQPAELARCALSSDDHALEYLLMSLRLSSGLDIERFNSISPNPLSRTVIAELKGLGMLGEESGKLYATRKGRVLLNAVIAKLAGA